MSQPVSVELLGTKFPQRFFNFVRGEGWLWLFAGKLGWKQVLRFFFYGFLLSKPKELVGVVLASFKIRPSKQRTCYNLHKTDATPLSETCSSERFALTELLHLDSTSRGPVQDLASALQRLFVAFLCDVRLSRRYMKSTQRHLLEGLGKSSWFEVLRVAHQLTCKKSPTLLEHQRPLLCTRFLKPKKTPHANPRNIIQTPLALFFFAFFGSEGWSLICLSPFSWLFSFRFGAQAL